MLPEYESKFDLKGDSEDPLSAQLYDEWERLEKPQSPNLSHGQK